MLKVRVEIRRRHNGVAGRSRRFCFGVRSRSSRPHLNNLNLGLVAGHTMAAKTPVKAIFDSLKGSWRLRRSLDSVLPGFPSGIFEGTATFKSREPTAHSVAGELLYSEQGELKTDNGMTLRANRKYIYRYNADEDKISAWFVKEGTKQSEGKEEVDYLFHDLEMDSEGNAWAGRGEHLCELDMYWAYYEFRMPKVVEEGKGMDVFGVRYKVKGPQKDYTSDTAYERTFSADVAVL